MRGVGEPRQRHSMEETLDRDRQRTKSIGHLRVLRPKWMWKSSKARKSVYVRLQCQSDI